VTGPARGVADVGLNETPGAVGHLGVTGGDRTERGQGGELVGGALRGSSFGTSGMLATTAIAQLTVDTTFIGCDGADLEHGVRFNSLQDAEIAAAMARRARRVVVLADSSKLGQSAIAGAVGWSDVDVLITDACDDDWRARLADAGVQVVIAEPPVRVTGPTRD